MQTVAALGFQRRAEDDGTFMRSFKFGKAVAQRLKRALSAQQFTVQKHPQQPISQRNF